MLACSGAPAVAPLSVQRGRRAPPRRRLPVYVCSRESGDAPAAPLVRRLGACALAVLLAAAPPSSSLLVHPALAFLDDQPPASRLSAEEQRTVALFRRATPSVVFVTNLQAQRDALTLDETLLPRGSGSGFVWDARGYVVTNLHVVVGAQDVLVSLDDATALQAKVVGFDEDKDVAVLKVNPGHRTLQPLALGSSSTLQVGQRLFAIGNPFGLDRTLTTGVVSGLGREIQSGVTGRPIRGVIQTDAAINPGNSGGPLLDSSGRLVGINTAIYSPSGGSAGVGFALPVDAVRGVVEQIISTGRVTRPVLGIVMAPYGAAGRLGLKGVLVLRAPREGPAGAAGVRGTTRKDDGSLAWGDVIVALDGAAVRDSAGLYRALDGAQPGQSVKLRVLRPLPNEAPAEMELQVVLGEKVTQFEAP